MTTEKFIHVEDSTVPNGVVTDEALRAKFQEQLLEHMDKTAFPATLMRVSTFNVPDNPKLPIVPSMDMLGVAAMFDIPSMHKDLEGKPVLIVTLSEIYDAEARRFGIKENFARQIFEELKRQAINSVAEQRSVNPDSLGSFEDVTSQGKSNLQ